VGRKKVGKRLKKTAKASNLFNTIPGAINRRTRVWGKKKGPYKKKVEEEKSMV